MKNNVFALFAIFKNLNALVSRSQRELSKKELILGEKLMARVGIPRPKPMSRPGFRVRVSNLGLRLANPKFTKNKTKKIKLN